MSGQLHAPITPWIEGSKSTTADLDAWEKKQISCPRRESNYDSSVFYPVA